MNGPIEPMHHSELESVLHEEHETKSFGQVAKLVEKANRYNLGEKVDVKKVDVSCFTRNKLMCIRGKPVQGPGVQQPIPIDRTYRIMEITRIPCGVTAHVPRFAVHPREIDTEDTIPLIGGDLDTDRRGRTGAMHDGVPYGSLQPIIRRYTSCTALIKIG